MNERILSVLHELTPAAFADLLTPDADLHILRLHPFDRAYTLPMAREEAFGIELPSKEIEERDTVADVVSAVERQSKEK
jgi:hypothetical protein